MLHPGTHYTSPWQTLYFTVADIILHSGTHHTSPWYTLYFTLADIILHPGIHYTSPWQTLYFTVADIILHPGRHYTSPWQTLYFTMADLFLPASTGILGEATSHIVDTTREVFYTLLYIAMYSFIHTELGERGAK